MIKWTKFRVFPWTLRVTFTSLRPTAVPLVETCIISRVKVGLSNLTPSNPTLVTTFSLEYQNRSFPYLLTPFPSILSCDCSHFNDVWSGLTLHNSENQNLFDFTTSRPKETLKQGPKVPLFPCPPFFTHLLLITAGWGPFSLVFPAVFTCTLPTRRCFSGVSYLFLSKLSSPDLLVESHYQKCWTSTFLLPWQKLPCT